MLIKLDFLSTLTFKKLFGLAAIMLATISCAQKPSKIVIGKRLDTSKSSYISKDNPFIVIVDAGDSLHKIARENAVDVNDLIKINDLEPPYTLLQNQVLRLPQPAFHVVKDGDTIYSISRGYGLDMDKILHANQISSPYIISEGSKLRLPHTDSYETYAYNTYKNSNKAEDVNFTNEEDREYLQNDIDANKPNLRQVIAKDLHLIDEETENPSFVLPNIVKNNEPFDPNAPRPTLKASKHPSPNFKPGTKRPITSNRYASINGNNKVVTKIEKASYTPRIKPRKRKTSNKVSFSWPTRGRVVSRFGPKQGGLYNDGINISAKAGSKVRASDSGEVVYSGNQLRGYGNLILVKHNNGYLTAYAHTKNVAVRKGDYVEKGQTIAYVGKSGHVSEPQLHFSIRKGRKAMNPQRYLPNG